MSRLQLSTTYADLDDALDAADPDRRLQAGWAAAQWAIHQTGLSHPAIAAARIGESTNAIASLVSDLDEQYFELQELCKKGERFEKEVSLAFSRARAANAVEFAVRGEAAEAVYEASVCCNDVSGLRRIVVVALA